MTDMLASNAHGRLRPGRLRRFEESAGFVLPDDYRAFLQQHNGGEPSPANWHCGPTVNDPVYGWTEISVFVRDFLSITRKPDYASIERTRDVYRDRIPPELLVIGDDGAGNAICLRVDGQDEGSIWFWFHENESDSAPWWNNLQLLAPTFTEFFEGLVDDEELERRVDADLRRVIEDGK
jgi:hypothetical protein